MQLEIILRKPVFISHDGLLLASSLGAIPPGSALRSGQTRKIILRQKNGKRKVWTLAFVSIPFAPKDSLVSEVIDLHIGSDLSAKRFWLFTFFLLISSIIFIALISVLALATKISYGITGAAEQVMKGIRKFQRGDLSHRIHIPEKDELGKIAGQRNEMAGSLDTTYLSLKKAESEIRKYELTLEDKVEQRTQELRESLERIQNMKMQQDADYYLTALLLEPLSKAALKGDYWQVESFLKPYKSFNFGKRQKSIGGDISITSEIRIGAKPFLLFLNADAMGKSMQGAGGALVLGAALQSRLAVLREEHKEIDPENILQEILSELDKIFMSFEGYMYATFCAGILSSNGDPVYSDGEHPPMTVLSGNSSTFLPSCRNYRLGGNGKPLEVKRAQIADGAILIGGSDGRSDVFLPDQPDIAQSIPDDLLHSLFREAKGNPATVYSLLCQHGRPADDFTLLAVHYSKENGT